MCFERFVGAENGVYNALNVPKAGCDVVTNVFMIFISWFKKNTISLNPDV